MSTTERPRILVVGGGYVGLYAARRILKKMRYGEATVTVVDPRSYMTYQPFLPEAAAGSISPRQVVVPLRRVLPKAEVLTGRVTTIDQDRKVATVALFARASTSAQVRYVTSPRWRPHPPPRECWRVRSGC